MFSRIMLLLIGLYGLSGVAVGAIGAHLVTEATSITLIEKASFYQLIHALALMAYRHESSRLARVVHLCWITGILLFCGSLYLKAFALTSSSPLAPLGGTLLMIGWLGLILQASRLRH